MGKGIFMDIASSRFGWHSLRKYFYITSGRVFLFVCIVLATILRFYAIDWGSPFQLHSDEKTIVEGAIDMIRRRSFEPHIFNRPDHFEAQCNALLFNVVSLLRFGMFADETFADHTMMYYTLGRMFTAFWGVLMVPLGYLICEKIFRGSGVYAAFFIAVCPSFVQHSHYVTPDIPITFMFMAGIYFAVCYMKQPSVLNIVWMSLFTALSITIKYPGAIFCLMIALVVVVASLRNRTYFHILSHGALAVVLIPVFIFLVSPVFFTNFGQVIHYFIHEARPHHLGADGLGFWGNLAFYMRGFTTQYAWLWYVFAVIGIIQLVRKKRWNALPVGFGLLYILVISFLALHWERWAVPMYISLIFLGAIGVQQTISFVRRRWFAGKNKGQKVIGIIAFAAVAVVSINVFLGGVVSSVQLGLKDTRILSYEYCQQHGINHANTAYDAYTALKPIDGPFSVAEFFELDDDGSVRLKPEYQDVTYVLISENMYSRHLRNPDSFEAQVYTYIQTHYQLIQEWKPEFKAPSTSFCSVGIIQKIGSLIASPGQSCGATNQLYKII